jgi:glycosyltransferase involved in cell wall biosynthesis
MTEHSEPLLSICIPTYSRASLLEEGLKAILSQLEGPLSGSVDVIVSDNASPDETMSVVARLKDQYPLVRLRYHRQVENIGGDANVAGCPHLAKGRFVWIVSDDDIVLPGAVQRIVGVLKGDPSADAVILNYWGFRESMDRSTPTIFPTGKDMPMMGSNTVLTFIGTYVTFISCMAFRRDLLGSSDHSRRIDGMAPACTFIDVLRDVRSACFVAEPTIAIRTHNQNASYSFYAIFVTKFAGMMRYALSRGFSPDAVRAVLRKHLRRYLFGFTLTFRLDRDFGNLKEPNYFDAARRLAAVYWGDVFFWTVMLPILLLPRFMWAAPMGFLRGLMQRRKTAG